MPATGKQWLAKQAAQSNTEFCSDKIEVAPAFKSIYGTFLKGMTDEITYSYVLTYRDTSSCITYLLQMLIDIPVKAFGFVILLM